MTEYLSIMLHREAEDLDIPPVPAARTLARGRTLRRNRRIRTGLAAAAVTAVALAGAASLPKLVTSGPPVAAGTPEAYAKWGAWSDGSAVYVGNVEVEIGGLVRRMFYTSEGVLVQIGRSLDGDVADGSYVLVRPDGSKQAVPVVTGDTVPATSITQPYLAYSAPNGAESYDLVLFDLSTGSEHARVRVDRGSGEQGWATPPVALGDGIVWAMTPEGWKQWNVATGAVTDARTDLDHGGLSPFADGRFLVVEGGEWQVRSMRSPRTSVGGGRTGVSDEFPGAALSPDAATVVIRPYGGGDRIFDVATGEQRSIPDMDWVGFTPGGNLLVAVVDEHDPDRVAELRSCDPDTGTCETADWKPETDEIRLGGMSYEG